MCAKITKMRLNGIENPIGYDTSSLSFSWIVEGTKSKFQNCQVDNINRSYM